MKKVASSLVHLTKKSSTKGMRGVGWSVVSFIQTDETIWDNGWKSRVQHSFQRNTLYMSRIDHLFHFLIRVEIKFWTKWRLTWLITVHISISFLFFTYLRASLNGLEIYNFGQFLGKMIWWQLIHNLTNTGAHIKFRIHVAWMYYWYPKILSKQDIDT